MYGMDSSSLYPSSSDAFGLDLTDDRHSTHPVNYSTTPTPPNSGAFSLPQNSQTTPQVLRQRPNQAPTIQLDLSEIPFRGRHDELNQLMEIYEQSMYGDFLASSSATNSSSSKPTSFKGDPNNDSISSSNSNVTANAIFISGDSGCGKTALVQKLQKDLLGSCACFIVTPLYETSKSQFEIFENAIVQLSQQLIIQSRTPEIQNLQDALEEDELAIMENLDSRFQDIFQENNNAKMIAAVNQTDSNGNSNSNSNNSLSDNSNEHVSSFGLSRRSSFVSREIIRPSDGTRTDWFYTKLQKILRVALRVLASPAFPIVWCLDNMHHVDQDTALILKSLLQTQHASGFLFLGCYRSDHPHTTMNTLLVLPSITILPLEGLKELDLNRILAHLTAVEENQCEELSAVIWKKTHGNPFWVIQFLQVLQDNKSLFYSFDTYRWVWDLRRIVAETNLTSNVVDIITKKVQRMPLRLQEALKVASCLGSQFDIDILTTVVASHSEMVKRQIKLSDGRLTFVSDEALRVIKVDLLKSLSVAENMMLLEITHNDAKTGEPVYKFTHDRIRSAIYSLLPDGEERDGLHLLIGKLLYRLNANGGGNGEDWMLMVATGQMNKASHLIRERKAQVKLAQLNLQAAKSAVQKSAFYLAADYLRFGLTMLRITTAEGCTTLPGWRDNYRLMLETTSSLSEILYIKGEHRECYTLGREVQKHGRTLKDRIRASMVLIELDGARENFDAALKAGYKLLDQMGVSITLSPSQISVSRELKKVKKLLQSMTDKKLLSLRSIMHEEHCVALRVMSLIAVYALFGGRNGDLAVLATSMMNLTMSVGSMECTSHVFAIYGVVAAAYGDLKEGYRFGRLALELVGRTAAAAEYLGRTYMFVFGFLNHLRRPFHQSLGALMEAHKTGLDSGDTEYGLLASTAYVGTYIVCGLTLQPIHEDIVGFQSASGSYSQFACSTLLGVYRNLVECLMGLKDNPCEIHIPTNANEMAIRYAVFARMMTAYLFQRVDLAQAHSERLDKMSKETFTGPEYTVLIMFQCLVSIAQLGRSGKSKYRTQADKLIKVLEEASATGNMNAHHSLCLCNAERASVSKKKSRDQVKAAYDVAISTATKTGFMQTAALASERAGVYFLSNKESDYGEHYLRKALEGYAEWGALAKAENLRIKYVFLRNLDVSNETARSYFGRQRFTPQFFEQHQDMKHANVARNSEDGSHDGQPTQNLHDKGNVVRSLFSRGNAKGLEDFD